MMSPAVVAVAADGAGEPPFHGVVEVEALLGLQLEQDGGDERLGDGADPVAVLRRPFPPGVQVTDARGAAPASGPVPGPGDGAGDPVPYRLFEGPPGGSVPVGGLSGRDGVRGGGRRQHAGGEYRHRRGQCCADRTC